MERPTLVPKEDSFEVHCSDHKAILVNVNMKFPSVISKRTHCMNTGTYLIIINKVLARQLQWAQNYMSKNH